MTSNSLETATIDEKYVAQNHFAVAMPDLTKVSPFAFPRPTDDAVREANILLVDDEIAVLKLLGKQLQEAGFQNVRALSDPSRAIAVIESLLPDLVLLDLRMRPVNGLEILEYVRRTERTQHIPVIVLTSDTKEGVEITALNLGANDFLTKPVRASQLGARVRNTLSIKVYRDLANEYSMQLETDVLSDALTGVSNRRAFEYEIKRRISEWNRHSTPFGLLMIDLDHFKRINDLHGHRVGDNALRDVAKVLQSATRDMDLITRYGGEEFAVVLPNTRLHESVEVAERIRQAIERFEFAVEEQVVGMTVSVGVANAMRSDDANFLVRRADLALYSAKQDGRNCSYYHDGANCVLLTEASETELNEGLSAQLRVMEAPIETAKVAIIDDEIWTIAVVKKYLKDAGFENLIDISDAEQALETIRNEQPDIVLLDVRMPKLSGMDILKELRNGAIASNTPVVIFTSASDKATKVKALNLGASDFLEKPVDSSELLARVRNTLLAKSNLDSLAEYSGRLEYEVRLRTTELSASRREAIQCLARAGELRDDQTGQHVLRVGKYAAIVAEELGFGEERVVWMEHAAQLHDVGKIGVPDSILHKPGKLTSEEWDAMKSHCLAGTRILLDETDTNEDSDGRHSPIMKMASTVAQTHHEKWDGSGYPFGLSGSSIPIEGRIAAVADVFDALCTKRSYKEAIPLDRCFEMLEEGRGTHFDPDVLDAFFRRKSDIVRIFSDYTDGQPVSCE